MAHASRPIKITLLVLQLLVIFHLILFMVYLFTVWSNTRSKKTVGDNMQTARLFAQLTKESLNQTLEISSILANNKTFQDSLKANNDEAVNMLQNAFYSMEDIDSVSVVAINGDVLLTTMPNASDRIVVTAGKYLQEIVEKKRPILTAIMKGSFSEKHLIAGVAPIIEDGHVTRYVLTSYDVSTLKSKLERSSSLDDIYLFFDQNRSLVFVLNKPFPNDQERTFFSQAPFLKNPQNGNVVMLDNQTLPLLEHEIIGTALNVDGSGWVVVSAKPMEKASSSLWTAQNILGIMILFSSIFSVVSAMYLLHPIKTS